MSSASICLVGQLVGVISSPSAMRTERLPEVPWLMPEAFITQAISMIASRSFLCFSLLIAASPFAAASRYQFAPALAIGREARQIERHQEPQAEWRRCCSRLRQQRRTQRRPAAQGLDQHLEVGAQGSDEATEQRLGGEPAIDHRPALRSQQLQADFRHQCRIEYRHGRSPAGGPTTRPRPARPGNTPSRATNDGSAMAPPATARRSSSAVTPAGTPSAMISSRARPSPARRRPAGRRCRR